MIIFIEGIIAMLVESTIIKVTIVLPKVSPSLTQKHHGWVAFVAGRPSTLEARSMDLGNLDADFFVARLDLSTWIGNVWGPSSC